MSSRVETLLPEQARLLLDYGGVDIVNLFANVGNGKAVIDAEIDKQNLAVIKKKP